MSHMGAFVMGMVLMGFVWRFTVVQSRIPRRTPRKTKPNKPWRLVISLALLPSVAFGAQPGTMSYIRVRNCGAGACVVSTGTATWLGKRDGRRLLLTCAHVVGRGEKQVIECGDNFRFKAKIEDIDYDLDLALLSAPIPGDKVGWKLGTRPQTGQQVGVAGMPLGKRFFARQRVTSAEFVEKLIETDGYVPQGVSGGPVYNGNHELCGIVSAGDRTSTVSVPISDIKVFLRRCGWSTAPAPVVPKPPVTPAPGVDLSAIEQALLKQKQQSVEFEKRLAELAEENRRLRELAGLPIDVKVLVKQKDGKEKEIAHETYPRGTPIILRFHESLLKGK